MCSFLKEDFLLPESQTVDFVTQIEDVPFISRFLAKRVVILWHDTLYHSIGPSNAVLTGQVMSLYNKQLE